MAFDLSALRAGYGAFLRDDRILLTGHSHQAWPDVARDAQMATFDDAATYVDDKWGAAVFPKIESVSRRVLARMGFAETDGLALGKSTHELVFRLLSCLKWHEKPRIVTSTSEFHSLHRQLSRLAEEGVEVVWVDATDRATLAQRVIDACTPGTAMVALSAVLFEDSFVVREIGDVIAHAASIGAIPLIDAYHAFNVAPIAWGPAASAAFVTAGGYKYAQFGEGVCWLRVPEGSTLRPVYTGWFADFEALEGPRTHHVGYGPGGARFTGATFDPSSVYRADAVLEFQDRHGLDVATLRAISIRQTTRIVERLEQRGAFAHASLRSSRDPERRGGFVSLETPHAQDAVKRLRERGVFTDARGDGLRLGPAPYLTDAEIDAGVDAVIDVLAGRLSKRDNLIGVPPPGGGAGGKPGRPDGSGGNPGGIADGSVKPGGKRPGGSPGMPPGGCAAGGGCWAGGCARGGGC